MRVLVVGPSMRGPGGVANYYSHIYPLLSRTGIETEYLAIGKFNSSVRYVYPFADQLKLGRAIDQYKPDLVHINPSLNLKSAIRDGLFCYQATRRHCPLLVFFRGWEEDFERKIDSGLRKPFLKTFGKATSMIVLAGRFRERLQHWGVTCPIHLATTAVPDNLLGDINILEKLAKAVKEDTTRVLYLGRLEPDKGVLETVRAVVRLAGEGLNISVTVAGDGSLMREVRAIKDSNSVAKNCIDIVGYVRGDEKIRVFASNHVYSFPSVYGEGMPNALLEAMFFGMPVITCPTGGIADFFEDGKMGTLLSGLSDELIVESIRKIHEDRQRIQNIGSYNHNYAVKHFMATSVADCLCDIYKQTLAV